ncbi:unnamed protein product [Sphacelaria rigidula]
MRGSHDQSVLSKGGQSRIPDLCDKLVQKYNLSDREVLEMVSTLSARLLRRSAEGAEGASGLQVSNSKFPVTIDVTEGGGPTRPMQKYEIGAAQKMLCVLAYAITGDHAQNVYNMGVGKPPSTRGNNVFVYAASHYIFYGNLCDPREEDRQIVHGMSSVKSTLLGRVRSCITTAVLRVVCAVEQQPDDTFANFYDDILCMLEFKSDADTTANILEVLVAASEEILSTWVLGHRAWSSGAYSKAGLNQIAGQGFASKFAEKVTRPMAIVCLEQARLFNRPGTNDAPCTLLERCFADWHESSKVSTKKTTDEEWKFPLSRAEVKKKKKEWDKSLWDAWDLVFCQDEGAPFKELARAAPDHVTADLVQRTVQRYIYDDDNIEKGAEGPGDGANEGRASNAGAPAAEYKPGGGGSPCRTSNVDRDHEGMYDSEETVDS